MTEIQKVSDLRPLSFDALPRGAKTGALMLVEFLVKFHREKREVTREDIITLHAAVLYKRYVVDKCGGSNRYTSVGDGYDENGHYKWKTIELNTIELIRLHRCGKHDSLVWFKHNLGSAILDGKILAIPVINI